jgi:hypothetical protein
LELDKSPTSMEEVEDEVEMFKDYKHIELV